jgi:eukaryotic-like serine/threonine-protein kinase
MSNVEQFGKYVLLEKIAAGGMAEVYLAKSAGANGINKFVAIKKILPQYSQNHEFVQFFKAEAEVTINLSHSNIVSIYDFGIENEQFFLVMELVEGRNLRQILNELKKINKSISIEQALYIIKEASSGLDHAHRCVDTKTGKPLNITHRDMSPQNVMISYEGEVKVIDFGIAKAETEGEATKAGTLKGKFAYMSPEQSEGYPIDPRTDVFALGIILWELLANDRLFTGSNEAAILRKVRECQIPSIRKINPLVPAELEKIVMKALAKDRNVRYQTAANLHKDLNRFLNTQYPDFAPQDFSVFIKDAFKTSFAEWREKIVKFSQVQNLASIYQSNPNKPKQSPFEKLSTATLPDVPTAAPKTPAAKKSGLNDALTQAPDVPRKEPDIQVAKIKLDGVRNASMSKSPHSASQGENGKLNQRKQVNNPNTSITTTRYNNSKKRNNEWVSLLTQMSIIFVLAGGTYYYYKNYYLKTGPQAQIEQEEPIDSPSLAPKIRVSVSSTPGGANIMIDGVYSGYRTPSVILVPAGSKTKIKLEHEDFFDREVEKVFVATDSIAFNLERKPQPGYINIYVSNGGPNTILFLNGRRINERPPLKKYPVTANSEIIIKAENPITQLTDTQKILVLPNKTVDLEMILGRKPAGTR